MKQKWRTSVLSPLIVFVPWENDLGWSDLKFWKPFSESAAKPECWPLAPLLLCKRECFLGTGWRQPCLSPAKSTSSRLLQNRLNSWPLNILFLAASVSSLQQLNSNKSKQGLQQKGQVADICSDRGSGSHGASLWVCDGFVIAWRTETEAPYTDVKNACSHHQRVSAPSSWSWTRWLPLSHVASSSSPWGCGDSGHDDSLSDKVRFSSFYFLSSTLLRGFNEQTGAKCMYTPLWNCWGWDLLGYLICWGVCRTLQHLPVGNLRAQSEFFLLL